MSRYTTPEASGASQLACDIINELFELDGFALVRDETFAAALARKIDGNETLQSLVGSANSVLANACDSGSNGPDDYGDDLSDYPRDENGKPWFFDFWELQQAVNAAVPQGDIITAKIYGHPCEVQVLERHPAGTMDVQRLSDGECFRLSGLTTKEG